MRASILWFIDVRISTYNIHTYTHTQIVASWVSQSCWLWDWKCLAPQNKAKSLYLGPFWVNFSTLLRNALDFQWYPLWLWFKIAKFGFWNSPKKCSNFLILGRREGVKNSKKNSLIFFLIWVGREGVQANFELFLIDTLFLWLT